MKKLQKLNEQFDIKEIESVINDNPGTIDDGMNEMDKMFENTSIGQIAKEITEDLDIENILNNGGGIQDLFSGGNMANIMKTISSKMVDKKDTMDSENLMKEASNICNSMQGNPLFSSLLGMQGGVMESMMQGMGDTAMPSQPKPEQVRKIEVKDNSHDPNKTKARLQKKLKENQMTVEKKE
jgi:hypothetical protein